MGLIAQWFKGQPQFYGQKRTSHNFTEKIRYKETNKEIIEEIEGPNRIPTRGAKENSAKYSC